jgi:predicted GIY-YIG superfamily endonuclease
VERIPAQNQGFLSKMLYYEAHLSKADAVRREQYFKTTKGKSTLRQMLRGSLEKI